MVYELELPEESKIHNAFHVSSLKKTVGQQITPFFELPPLYDEGFLVLGSRENSTGSRKKIEEQGNS